MKDYSDFSIKHTMFPSCLYVLSEKYKQLRCLGSHMQLAKKKLPDLLYAGGSKNFKESTHADTTTTKKLFCLQSDAFSLSLAAFDWGVKWAMDSLTFLCKPWTNQGAKASMKAQSWWRTEVLCLWSPLMCEGLKLVSSISSLERTPSQHSPGECVSYHVWRWEMLSPPDSCYPWLGGGTKLAALCSLVEQVFLLLPQGKPQFNGIPLW